MKLQMKTAEREEKQKMTVTDFDTHLLHERTRPDQVSDRSQPETRPCYTSPHENIT